MTLLRVRTGVDLMDAGAERELGQNFHELAMREPCRVDLRHGPRMKQAARSEGKDPTERDSCCHELPSRHPAIMAVLDRVMNPSGAHSDGNFGRWNFDGGAC